MAHEVESMMYAGQVPWHGLGVKVDECIGTDDEIANDNGTGDKVFERIEPLFYTGRGNEMPGVRDTWWAAYNAVTEYTSHVRGGDRAIRLESQWMGDGNRINSKALSTALKMAMGAEAN